MKSSIPSERRQFLEKVRRLVFTNPFSAERMRLDAEILKRPLGPESRPISWRIQAEEHADAMRIAAITRRELEAIPAEERRAALGRLDEDSFLLRDVICFLLFHEHYSQIDELIERTLAVEPEEAHKLKVPLYATFEREIGRWFELRNEPVMRTPEGIPVEGGNLVIDRAWAARVFAVCYQIRRAYYFIYHGVVGVSAPMMRLRESIWEVVFTRDFEWYWRFLLGKLSDFSTLIVGPTGSGKEQVALSICRSQYIPFNPETRRFETDDRALFLPINLAAVSPTLIESELFGHVKGAFTGAHEDREGLMSGCSPYGAVFLDEIGELAPELQVKLLRVLQSRTFNPLGSRKVRRFEGRIVSATNQDVGKLIRDGGMREDFYYRISACQIETPSLRRRFEEDEEEIVQLTTFLIRRMIGREVPEVERMLVEAVAEATRAGRPWRGNVRELEQFIRRRLTTHAGDEPAPASVPGGQEWLDRASRAELSVDELMRHYCKLARGVYGNWERAAEKLQADWRTIKKWAKSD